MRPRHSALGHLILSVEILALGPCRLAFSYGLIARSLGLCWICSIVRPSDIVLGRRS
jgi:hypothetical protein